MSGDEQRLFAAGERVDLTVHGAVVMEHGDGMLTYRLPGVAGVFHVQLVDDDGARLGVEAVPAQPRTARVGDVWQDNCGRALFAVDERDEYATVPLIRLVAEDGTRYPVDAVPSWLLPVRLTLRTVGDTPVFDGDDCCVRCGRPRGEGHGTRCPWLTPAGSR